MKRIRAQEKEFTGFSSSNDSDDDSNVGSAVAERKQSDSESDSDMSDFVDSDDEQVHQQPAPKTTSRAGKAKDASSKTTDLWFSRAVFKDLDMMDEDESDDDQSEKPTDDNGMDMDFSKGRQYHIMY